MMIIDTLCTFKTDSEDLFIYLLVTRKKNHFLSEDILLKCPHYWGDLIMVYGETWSLHKFTFKVFLNSSKILIRVFFQIT